MPQGPSKERPIEKVRPVAVLDVDFLPFAVGHSVMVPAVFETAVVIAFYEDRIDPVQIVDDPAVA